MGNTVYAVVRVVYWIWTWWRGWVKVTKGRRLEGSDCDCNDQS